MIGRISRAVAMSALAFAATIALVSAVARLAPQTTPCPPPRDASVPHYEVPVEDGNDPRVVER